MRIDYGVATLDTFHVTDRDDKTGAVTRMLVDNHLVEPTQRFWTSLCSNYSTYGLSTKLFKLFTHAEVFERVTTKLGNVGKDQLRYTIERTSDGDKLLGISRPGKAHVRHPDMLDMLKTRKIEKIEYEEGVIRTTHSPGRMHDFSIGPDQFKHQYVLETPIDGFGLPLIYLAFNRVVCTNGMIAYSRAFRSEINIGKKDAKADPMFTIDRALDSFSNDEGYAALRQRFEAATESWASISEVQKVYKTMMKMLAAKQFHPAESEYINKLAKKRDEVLGAYHPANLEKEEQAEYENSIKIQRAYGHLAGDLVGIYALTHLDAMSNKKQSHLPAPCTMYELLNYTTELATHYTTEADGRQLQALVGGFVTSEFDLENTKKARPTFQDWFVRTNDQNCQNN